MNKAPKRPEDPRRRRISSSSSFSCGAILLLLLVVALVAGAANALSGPPPRGSASSPLSKKRVAVLGCGGYVGAVAFGFLQRAVSLYGTGIGSVRAVGATADTAKRLNRVLSKNFCLAVADESYIKLTDLASIDAIEARLEGWDALMVGNCLDVKKLPVTLGSYERTPNDKTYEVYWNERQAELDGEAATLSVGETVLRNALDAARRCDSIRHVLGVDDADNNGRLKSLLEEYGGAGGDTGFHYTCIEHAGSLLKTKDYTYRKGIQNAISVMVSTGGTDDDGAAIGTGQAPTSASIASEDVAALCVQSLLYLDWNTSRSLRVSASQGGMGAAANNAKKRPDQEWCVNSDWLLDCLYGIS